MRPGSLLLTFGLLAIVACGGGGGAREGGEENTNGGAQTDTAAAATAPGAPGSRVVFTCHDGYRFVARFRDDGVALVLPASTHELARAEAPGRYHDDRRFLRVWGEHQARYESPDGGRRRCSGVVAADPREESALLGYDYRAQGQEPGWTLEIDTDRWIRYAGDYGSTILLLPVPPAIDSAGAQVFHATGAAHDLRVVLLPGPCTDIMSGDAFADRVEITLDGETQTGCGELLSH